MSQGDRAMDRSPLPWHPDNWYSITGRDKKRRRLSLGHLIATSLIAVLTALTALIALVPSLQFYVVWPGAREQIATAGALIALLTSALAYLWYSFAGTRSTLLIAIAFLVLGANQLMFGVAFNADGSSAVGDRQGVYFWMAGRILTAVLLLLGARERGRSEGRLPRHPLIVFVLGSAAALGTLAFLQGVLWLGREALPSLCCGAFDRGVVDASAPGPTPLAVAIGVMGALVYLAAAYLFRSEPSRTRLPRGDWLSIALIFGAFSNLHYLLAPTVFSSQIATGDLLRMAQFTVLFFGLLWEVRLLLQQERDRATELTAMSAMKDEVSRIVTHDLVHSIATVRNFSVHLADRWSSLQDDARQDTAVKIERQSARLSKLAEDTVAALSLAPDAMWMSMSPYLASDLVREAAAMAEPGRQVQMHIDADASRASVLADESAMLRVMSNLLWNAEAYGGEGSPVVIDLSADERDVMIAVTDRGPGIPTQELDGLFERFHRGSSAVDGPPGQGLGLYLSRAIVEAHGGRIWADSTPGSGSTFRMSLPRTESIDA